MKKLTEEVCNFSYGCCDGRYFTDWRFDNLKSVAFEVEGHFGVKDFHLWYDEKNDFHHMSFRLNDRDVNLRYYKVCNILVDGVSLTDFPVPVHRVFIILLNKLVFKN